MNLRVYKMSLIDKTKNTIYHFINILNKYHKKTSY